MNDEPKIAFGGKKLSGAGRFGCRWTPGEFTTEHWTPVKYEPRAYSL